MTEAEWLACIDPGPMLDFLNDKASDRKLQLFACECCRHVIHLFRFNQERSLLDKAEQYAESKIGKDDLRRSAVELLLREPLSLSDAQEALFTLAGMPSNCVCGWMPSGHDLWPVINPNDPRLSPQPIAHRTAKYAAWALARETDNIGVEAALEQACDIAKDVAPSLDLEDELRETAKTTEGIASWKTAFHSAEAAQCRFLRDIIGNPFRPTTIDSTWLTPKVVGTAQEIYDERAFERLPILADALEEAGSTNPDLLDHCRGPGPHVRGCWVVDLVLGKG